MCCLPKITKALRFKMAMASVRDMLPKAGRIIEKKSSWETVSASSVLLSSGSASVLKALSKTIRS